MAIAKQITNQVEVLRLLANDPTLQFSVDNGPRVVRVESDYSVTTIARVKSGIASDMLYAGLMRYTGSYELTEKGKAECLKLKNQITA